MLQDNGLIEYEGGRQTYRTAEKGMKLLEIYEKMYELVPPLAPTTERDRNQNRRLLGMDQRNTTRSILAVMIASISSIDR